MNDISLLGGAQRGKTRPRGFAPWKPQATALAQEAPPKLPMLSATSPSIRTRWRRRRGADFPPTSHRRLTTSVWHRTTQFPSEKESSHE